MLDAFGLYRPGHTPLHRLPAWVKVLLLVAVGVGMVITRGPAWTAGWYVGALAALASALPPLRATLRGLAPVAILAGLMGGYQWFRGDRTTALEFAADFIAISCCALAVTTSTPLDESMALISRAARPFRRVVPPEALALMFSLTLRAIPEVNSIMRDAFDAARARGLGRSPRAWLIPSAVRTFGWALAVGDAITARGLADEAADSPTEESPTRVAVAR